MSEIGFDINEHKFFLSRFFFNQTFCWPCKYRQFVEKDACHWKSQALRSLIWISQLGLPLLKLFVLTCLQPSKHKQLDT